MPMSEDFQTLDRLTQEALRSSFHNEDGEKRKAVSSTRGLAATLAPEVKQLWQLLNPKRPRKLPLYMNDAEGARAYLASFFLPNVFKTLSILELPENSAALQRVFQSKRKKHTLVDHGSGPLTASLALVLWMKRHLSGKTFEEGEELRVLAVEASNSILQTGIDLLQQFSLDLPFAVSVEKVGVRQLEPETVHLFFSVNALNEFGQMAKGILNSTVAKLVDRGAFVLFVEPGQDVHARKLGDFRNSLLSKSKKARIVGPCTHSHPCPLTSSAQRKDWCWFRMKWERTPLLKQIDRSTGLKHEELNYSYFSCMKQMKQVRGSQPTTATAPGWARVVSDAMPLPAAKRPQLKVYMHRNPSGLGAAPTDSKLRGELSKCLACSHEGKLCGVFNKGKALPTRGEKLEQPPQEAIICREKDQISQQPSRAKRPAVLPKIVSRAQKARRQRNSNGNLPQKKKRN